MTIPNSDRTLSDRHIVRAIASDATLRPDAAAAIRAAQHVWLDDSDAPTRSRNIDAFIDMLVDQASFTRRGR
jgi:hypothetical protein